MKRILTALAAGAALGANAANPIFTDTFTADPAPIVVGDTCYVVTTQDENDGTPGQWLIMNNWRAYSSKDMRNWKYHGVIMDWKTYSWGGSDSWASQVAKGADGRFYHYTTLRGGHVYVVELVAKKNTSPVVWFASRDDKFRSGAAYRDGKKMAKGKDNKETVDFGMALYGKARGI